MNTKNLKPFNLEAALAGEPVMLRDGSKAFVRHYESETQVYDNFRLWGVAIREDGRAAVKPWSKNGRFIGETLKHGDDIIGMWQKTRIINGFEVPAPETIEPENGTIYFAPNVLAKELYSGLAWSDCEWDERVLSRGFVFLNKEDAIANAKAMLGINPYEEGEEWMKLNWTIF